MRHTLKPSTALLLAVPPLLWAGNAVVGRWMNAAVPPVTLNLLRWLLAFLLLLPLGGWILRPGSGLYRYWRRYALLGLLGVGSYNALQYLALQTSTPINVTLVAASSPVWMLAVGALFFGQRIRTAQAAGAVLSIAGVLVVLLRGDLTQLLQVRLVTGDAYMLLATALWAGYSWLLAQPQQDLPGLRSDWAAFLLAQVAPGVLWSASFAAVEWSLGEAGPMHGSWSVAAALCYVALGPAILAYRCWGLGVQRVGPAVAGFFANLTPLFAALLSAAFLGEPPHAFHALAFALIVGGIVVSSLGGSGGR